MKEKNAFRYQSRYQPWQASHIYRELKKHQITKTMENKTEQGVQGSSEKEFTKEKGKLKRNII